MTFVPYPSQVDDLAKLRANNYTGLLAVEMGGGKTVSSLMAVKDSGADQTLVIAPQNTHKRAWKEDAELVLGLETRVIGNGTKAQRQALSDMEWGEPGIYAVTPQLFTRADISMWTPDMLIVDEAHMLSKAGTKGQRKLSGFGAKDDPISRQVGMALALSGTPFRNNFERAWALTRLLWPELYRSRDVAYDNYWGWLGQRMNHQEVIIGKDANGGLKRAKKWTTERNPGELFSELPCVVQHFRRRECCQHHPTGFLLHEEPNESTRTVEITPTQKRIIKELESQGLAWLDDHPLSADLPIVLQQRIRQTCLGVPSLYYTGEVDEYGIEKSELDFEQDCKSAFIDEVFDVLEQWEGETAIIYMVSQRFARVLTHRLNQAGIPSVEYSGAKSKAQREQEFEEFGTKYRVMVATIDSVGTGTDGLQKVCSNEIWLERSLDETSNMQAEGRTDRMGSIAQTQRVIIEDDLGYAAGRYSEQMMNRLQLAKSTTLQVQ